MRAFLFIISISLIFYVRLTSQDCLSGATLFSTQQQIDNFKTDYPGCIRISGSIVIQGNDIVNLNGFSGITTISGNITISNNALLLNLNGLSSLDSVGGNFFIQHNDELLNLQDLSSLDYVGGTLDVSSNENLTCFSGLGSLDYIGSSLIVRNNLVLTCFAGLTHLDTIAGSLTIENNQSMTDLSGLSSLKLVGGNLRVANNLGLKNFNGLNVLKMIGGNLDIFNNQSLLSLNGFSSLMTIEGSLLINRNHLLIYLLGLNQLTTINGDLSVINNESLLNLCGLENINPESIDSVVIINNEVLSICNVQSICDYLSVAGNPATVENNADGCNNVQQILDACETTFDCSVLPVEITGFNGYHTKEGNLLEWSTAVEINNDYFEIERSENANFFTVIGILKGAGNSNRLVNYKWVDKSPFKENSYYRLKQVDFDSKFSYSAIIKITNLYQQNHIIISPNPASDFLFLNTDNRNQTIEIYNTNGALQEKFAEVPDYINLTFYKNGIYFINLGGVMSKFIVQH